MLMADVTCNFFLSVLVYFDEVTFVCVILLQSVYGYPPFWFMVLCEKLLMTLMRETVGSVGFSKYYNYSYETPKPQAYLFLDH